MSISSFCIEQREKEQEVLRKFLAFSLAGSVVLNVGLVFGMNWLVTRQAEFVEDPIEVTVVENPDTEEKPLVDTPSPKTKPVETPAPQQPIKTEITQQPIPQPVVPQKLVIPQPVVPSRLAVRPVPAAPPAQAALPAPSKPIRERQSISSPPEPAPISPPSSVATNRLAPPQPDSRSQTLPTDSGARQLRERLGGTTNAEPDASDNGSTSPGAVAANRSAPPRPRGSSQPIIGSSSGSRQFRENLGGTGSSEATSPASGDSDASSTSPGAVAANRSAPPRPGSGNGGQGTGNPGGIPGGVPGGTGTRVGAAGVSCISGCHPEYPSVLKGEEGRAVVRLVLDSNGDVVDSQIAGGDGSSQLNQEALEAAKKMKFRVPGGGNSFALKLTINFTLRGSEFDRRARESQAQKERERQQREQERLAQLERERQTQQQERQAQLERKRQEQQERKERERQEQQQQEKVPLPTPTP